MNRATLATIFFFVIFSLSLNYAVAVENISVSLDTGKTIEENINDDVNANITTDIDRHGAKSPDSPSSVNQQRKWISQLFLEAVNNFHIGSNASERCKHDFQFYTTHLQNQSIWAVRMMESSEWPVVGLFAGTTNHIGNYDECLLVSSHGISGQYCVAEATFNPINKKTFAYVYEHPNEESSAWDAIEMYQENPIRVDRHRFNWALCIPSSCSSSDLAISLDQVLRPIFTRNELNISVRVDPMLCRTRKPLIYPNQFYSARTFFILLFVVVMSSTICDMMKDLNKHQKKAKINSNLVDILRSFSIVKNFKKLKKINPNDIASIHSIKVINMVLIIYGHRILHFIGYPIFNAEAIENKVYMPINFDFVHLNVVDIFFMISGFLTYRFGLIPMSKRGSIYLFFSIISRWVRMVPAFGVLMIFIIYIFPYIDEGPFWNHVTREADMCRQSWWTSMLAINNFVLRDKQCLVVSWYISTDIQLSIIGSILLYIFTKNKKFGIFCFFIAFIFSLIGTFMVAYVNEFHGILRLFITFIQEPRKFVEFYAFYVASFTRAGPYLLGIATAFISDMLKKRGYDFSNKQKIILSITSILICESSQLYGGLFYDFGREYNRLEHAMYATLYRSVFVLPYVVHICMYFTSGLGIFNKLFEWKVWIPFGRLTYSVFLINTVIQLYHSSHQRTLMPTYTGMNLIWWTTSDIVVTYSLGFIFHLFAEAPIINLYKVLERNLYSIFSPSRIKGSVEKIVPTANKEIKQNLSEEDYLSETPKQNGVSYQNEFNNECFVENEPESKV